MAIKIRKALAEEIEEILKIYSDAREYMKLSGNPNQWGRTYPEKELLLSDISKGELHVAEESGEILAVFVYFMGEDKTYLKIYDGDWKNDLPYGVIHRIAVSNSARGRGIARICFDYAFSLSGNLKIDTHRDNFPMQRVLEKSGFERCGIIYLENGDERIAFQKAK